MNRSTLEGNWQQARAEARAKWGRLTDDDLERIDGGLDRLVGRLQERYGMEEEKARRQVEEWDLEKRETGSTPYPS